MVLSLQIQPGTPCLNLRQTVLLNVVPGHSAALMYKTGQFLYSTPHPVHSPRIAPWHTCSIKHHLDFSGEHPALLQVMPLSIARYSFIKLGELEQQCEKNCSSTAFELGLS